MALKLRMTRRGTTNRPFYHIVATDSRAPRDGNYLEKLGTYNPLATTDKVTLEADRIKHWLSVGAQPSDRVAKMLGQAGLAAMPKISERPQKSAPKKKAQERSAAKAEKEAAIKEAQEQKAAEPAAPAAAETPDAQPVTNADADANPAGAEAV